MRNSGGISNSPRTATYTLNDYGTGLAAAYAVILALIERQKTGTGQRVEAALTYTSANLSEYFTLNKTLKIYLQKLAENTP